MTTTFNIIAPRYVHDCDACTFVGYDGDADVYETCCGSVLRRYSDEGADYSSFPIDLAKQLPTYAEAVALVENFQRIPA